MHFVTAPKKWARMMEPFHSSEKYVESLIKDDQKMMKYKIQWLSDDYGQIFLLSLCEIAMRTFKKPPMLFTGAWSLIRYGVCCQDAYISPICVDLGQIYCFPEWAKTAETGLEGGRENRVDCWQNSLPISIRFCSGWEAKFLTKCTHLGSKRHTWSLIRQ